MTFLPSDPVVHREIKKFINIQVVALQMTVYFDCAEFGEHGPTVYDILHCTTCEKYNTFKKIL